MKKSKKKLVFFLVTFFKTRTGSREKFCEYVGADGFMRLIRAGHETEMERNAFHVEA